ncbi:MAG: hypothetical protein WC785_04465 [Tatlockia sp.]|jgi:hypothetical protein
MKSLQDFIVGNPFFSMLVFIGIGFLLRSLKRLNRNAVRNNIEHIELALEDNDIEKAKHFLQQLKSGLGV